MVQLFYPKGLGPLVPALPMHRDFNGGPVGLGPALILTF